jgi:hypothetical protein
MRSVRLLGLLTVTALGTSMMLAPQAAAYDREAYSYAASHMIQRSDIPMALGDFRSGLNFNGMEGLRVSVCAVPQSDSSQEQQQVMMARPAMDFTGSYFSAKDDGPVLEVSVRQYPTATKAIKAFDALKKNIKRCTGTGSSSWTDEDGVTATYSTQVSNAVVPGVTVVGVESLSVTQNNLSQSAPADADFINDSYSVFTLVNDVILQTSYNAFGSQDPTKAQRKAVDQVAFNAVGRWVG